jgi:RNA polymerase sigma factor (sigma-70 family)
MSLSPGRLDYDELARRCRQESERYLAGRSHDETYCFELFRRAIFDHDQMAWQAVYAQYQALVTHWVRQHSKFQPIDEEPAFFVNAAFAGFWRRVSKLETTLHFNNLGQLLQYLKYCAHSAIEDEYRRQQHWPPDTLAWDDLAETVVDNAPCPEERAISQAEAATLERAILNRLQNEAEAVVATLSWRYGLRPREIQRHRPDLFTDASQVCQVKRNILNRLLRDPYIRWLRQQMR